MGIINELITEKRMRSSITDPWQWPSLSNFLSANTISTAGVAVNETKMLQLSVVYACIRLISNTIGMLPFTLHQEVSEGKSRYASEKPLYKVLYRLANPNMTAYQFKSSMQALTLMYGNSYALKKTLGSGEVYELEILRPWDMTVTLNKKGQRVYTYKDGFNVMEYQASKIFHLPGLSFDGIQGYSPIQIMRNEIGLGIALQEFGSRYFSNSTNIGGVAEHPGKLGEKARTNLKTDLQENFSNINNSHKLIILEEGMKYQKIGIPANDAQFIESRKFELEEIARYFGIQLHMIQNLDRSTNNNIEQQSIEFKTYAIQPWAVTWEQETWRSLLTLDEQNQNYYAKFNLNALMRGDYKTRMEGYRTGVQMGLYSLNEVRRLEDMNPIEQNMGGDTHWVNAAMIPINTQMNIEIGGQNDGGQQKQDTGNGTKDNND
jgi:HK97 family phage portal protein